VYDFDGMESRHPQAIGYANDCKRLPDVSLRLILGFLSLKDIFSRKFRGASGPRAVPHVVEKIERFP
jgi:hypothetical protein